MDSVSFQKRLATFNTWPHSFASSSPEKLAHAGFHYTKDGDIVQCNTCGVQIGNWQAEDDPITEHKKSLPNCQFLMELTGIKPTKEPHHHRCIEDDSGPFGFKYTVPDKSSITGPRYPRLVSKEARLKTFKFWSKQKPIELVEAGFFYGDVGDVTFCFYCGVRCQSWKDEDVPWEEHAKLSPDCAYLQLHKGSEFVNRFANQNVEEVAAQGGRSSTSKV